jgi:alpha/beta superfamily hydrolase
MDLTLETDDGETLEAQLSLPDGASTCVVLAHPHPLYGGSMWDGPPEWLFRSLPVTAGVGVLRFNFRSVGASTGTHDGGDAERTDVLAAIAAVPDARIVLCGYSFGADVCLAVDHERVVAWCGIAPPMARASVVADTARPKLVLVPEHDAYNPPQRARGLVAGWANTTLEVLPGADHFLGGSLGRIVEAVTDFV